jgi:tetratricopeptide (TPR) repeat protein
MPDKQFPNPAKVLGTWAAVLVAAGIILAAHEYWLFGQAEALRAASPWACLKTAERFEAQGNWQGALDMLGEAARRDPASPLPYERMGMLYYNQQKQWPKALEAFRNAIARGSKDIDVRGKIMWCLIHLGEYRTATEFGKACMDEGFDSPHFPRYIAEACRRAGEDAESIPYFEQALEGFPGDLYLMERLMQAYRKVGNAERAEALQQQIERREESN